MQSKPNGDKEYASALYKLTNPLDLAELLEVSEVYAKSFFERQSVAQMLRIADALKVEPYRIRDGETIYSPGVCNYDNALSILNDVLEGPSGPLTWLSDVDNDIGDKSMEIAYFVDEEARFYAPVPRTAPLDSFEQDYRQKRANLKYTYYKKWKSPSASGILALARRELAMLNENELKDESDLESVISALDEAPKLIDALNKLKEQYEK